MKGGTGAFKVPCVAAHLAPDGGDNWHPFLKPRPCLQFPLHCCTVRTRKKTFKKLFAKLIFLNFPSRCLSAFSDLDFSPFHSGQFPVSSKLKSGSVGVINQRICFPFGVGTSYCILPAHLLCQSRGRLKNIFLFKVCAKTGAETN